MTQEQRNGSRSVTHYRWANRAQLDLPLVILSTFLVLQLHGELGSFGMTDEDYAIFTYAPGGPGIDTKDLARNVFGTNPGMTLRHFTFHLYFHSQYFALSQPMLLYRRHRFPQFRLWKVCPFHSSIFAFELWIGERDHEVQMPIPTLHLHQFCLRTASRSAPYFDVAPSPVTIVFY